MMLLHSPEITVVKSPILIVEDDKAVRDSLRMVLEIYGYAVEVFASGEALLTYKGLGGSRCVILDVNLPGASGLETLARMHSEKIAVPAIVVSGRANRDARAQAEKLKALAFFDKPIDIDALLSTLHALGT
ncbi:Response regulator receiver domain-containing protein [Chelatococcus asaccharovorans]|nr:Response regulator receiver domain-containing protein [Chelatococcus asaccharovorans]CAH1684053.1 Response regulator receiver domain-containing protein [Chelatococcus asaccharovorans]